MKYKLLAGLAILLGVVALIIGNPIKTKSTGTDNIEITAQKVADNQVGSLKVQELADWLIEGRRDYKLVDLRNADEYAKFYLPGAMNLPINEFSKDYFLKTDKVVLYSDNDKDAADAWLILKNAGYYAVYVIYDGVGKWQREVLFPKRPPNASPEELREFNKRAEIALYLGGKPYGYTPGVAPVKTAPPAPAAPAGAPAKKKNPKIGGGC